MWRREGVNGFNIDYWALAIMLWNAHAKGTPCAPEAAARNEGGRGRAQGQLVQSTSLCPCYSPLQSP